MIPETDRAYIAGLFDGEGSIYYKKVKEKKKKHKGQEGYRYANAWRISMEITMTDRSVIEWVHEVLGVGTFAKKPPGKGQIGRKMQYRWRCGYRDAYYVCLLIWPWSHTKLPKINQILEHYADSGKVMNGKVVSLQEYREAMNLE